MIKFRKENRVLRTNLSDGVCGFPDISFHGEKPWREQFAAHERYVGVLFAGKEEQKAPEIVYVASNAYWEDLEILLPKLPGTMRWELMADTWESEFIGEKRLMGDTFVIRPRSVMIWKAMR